MNLFEEAVIYATVMHSGKYRKRGNSPYILHPIEVAQIISTMTDDIEVITAGVLHDVVEDTDGTLQEIRARFGERVAKLVDAETEPPFDGEAKEDSWMKRKQESLYKLKNADDIGIKILWLADKLSNMRSFANAVSEEGPAFWQRLHQKDPAMHKWYYTTIAEEIEIDLNRTGAFKEFLKHINFIWPGTFDSAKSKFKKYKEMSVDGCKIIGKGAKGTVYRYDDELIVKVYNENNMFKDIERENYLARKAFIAGIPTAISFGIVRVGNQYASVFELLNANTLSKLIGTNLDSTDYYAKVMADLAKQIHTTEVKEGELPDTTSDFYRWLEQGLGYEEDEKETYDKVKALLDTLPKVNTMIHGDFHSGNIMSQNDEFLLIDMDGLSTCPPIMDLCGLYMAYVGLGEMNKSVVENFMEFSYEKSLEFYNLTINHYFEGESEEKIEAAKKKIQLVTYVRMLYRAYKKGRNLSDENKLARDHFLAGIKKLAAKLDTLVF